MVNFFCKEVLERSCDHRLVVRVGVERTLHELSIRTNRQSYIENDNIQLHVSNALRRYGHKRRCACVCVCMCYV